MRTAIFDIGARVKVVKVAWNGEDSTLVGLTGTVVRFDRFLSWPYYVKFDTPPLDNIAGACWFTADEIEEIE